MGEAFARGFAGSFPDVTLLVAEKAASRVKVAETLPNCKITTPAEAYGQADIALLAVKPQDMDALLVSLPRIKDKHVVSIAAGKPISVFRTALGTNELARFMPNIAAAIGKASVAVSIAEGASEVFRNAALALAGAVGSAWEIPESMMGAFTGISGSGIAYVYSFVHAMAMGAVASGMPYAKALPVIIETLISAASLLKEGGESPAALIPKVMSPGGTTVAGFECLERGRFTATVMEAVRRTAERSRELEGA